MTAVDLHTHSNCSDGSLTPEELISLAAKKNLSAIALTDHDTISGLEKAVNEGRKYPGLEVIPGIEFSTEYLGKDVHIVGLGIDYTAKAFTEKLEAFRNSREERNMKMLKKLEDAGLPINYDLLRKEYPGSIITRGHYARYLVLKGVVSSTKEAFDRYVGDNSPYFVPREKVTPSEAIQLINDNGGISVLAHPVLYKLGKEELEKLVKLTAENGLMAIECVYSTYTPSDERDIKSLADKYGLLYSGGSDFHGKLKPDIDLGTGKGKLFVPEEFWTNMKQKLNKE